MRGFCRKCGQTFDDQMLCPQCGIQLREEGEGTTVPRPVTAPDDALDGPPLFRRCALGGITLIGLYHGLKHLALALLLMRTGAAVLAEETLMGLAAVATFGAAAVAGTVNRRAEATGFLLGAVAASGMIGMDVARGEHSRDEWLFGLPLGLVLSGVGGGLVGRRLIPPAPIVARFGRQDLPDRPPVRSRPPRLAWVRIVLGAAVAVGGTVYADAIRAGLSSLLAGHSGGFAAGRLVTWQITVIAALLGGFAAGAQTRRGPGQGFIAGLLAAAGVVAALGATDMAASHVVEFWMDQLGEKELGGLTVAALGGTAWFGAVIGGWLGGQLFPAGGAK